MDQAPFGLAEQVGLQLLLDISGAKEKQGLGNRMKRHV